MKNIFKNLFSLLASKAPRLKSGSFCFAVLIESWLRDGENVGFHFAGRTFQFNHFINVQEMLDFPLLWNKFLSPLHEEDINDVLIFLRLPSELAGSESLIFIRQRRLRTRVLKFSHWRTTLILPSLNASIKLPILFEALLSVTCHLLSATALI